MTDVQDLYTKTIHYGEKSYIEAQYSKANYSLQCLIFRANLFKMLDSFLSLFFERIGKLI